MCMVRFGVRHPSENCYMYINLRHLFPRVTHELGRQFHVNFEVGLPYVLNRLSLEEHNLRFLRKALFLGRC